MNVTAWDDVSTRGGMPDFIAMADGMCVFNAGHGIGDLGTGFFFGTLESFARRIGRSIVSVRRYVRDLQLKGILRRGWGRDKNGYRKSGFFFERGIDCTQTDPKLISNCNQTDHFPTLYKLEEELTSKELKSVPVQSLHVGEEVRKNRNNPALDSEPEQSGVSGELLELRSEQVDMFDAAGGGAGGGAEQVSKAPRKAPTPKETREAAKRVANYERKRRLEHPRSKGRTFLALTLPLSVRAILKLMSDEDAPLDERTLKAVVELRWKKAIDNEETWGYWRSTDLWKGDQIRWALTWLQEDHNSWAFEAADRDGAEPAKTAPLTEEDLQRIYEQEMLAEGRELFEDDDGVKQWWLPGQILKYRTDRDMEQKRATDAQNRQKLKESENLHQNRGDHAQISPETEDLARKFREMWGEG